MKHILRKTPQTVHRFAPAPPGTDHQACHTEIFPAPQVIPRRHISRGDNFQLLRIAALSPRAEGQAAATTVLERVPRPVLVPALLRALAAPNDVLRAAAGARLTKLTGGAPAFDAAADPLEVARAFQAWWWRETHPGETLDDVVRRLEDENPTQRWRAAQALSTLPTPHARNALAASLAREQLGWVLEGKLEALATVLGEPLGFRKGLAPAEQRACADRLRLRVVERIQDELREDAIRRGAPR